MTGSDSQARSPTTESLAARRQAGFSLLELAVSSTLLLLALLLVGEQLGAARLQVARGEAHALEPSVILAIEQLRADILLSKGADTSSIFAASNEWTHEPLSLRGHPAGTVVFALEGRQLIRRLPTTSGDPGRPMLSGVTLFRWLRRSPGDVLQIEVAYRRPSPVGTDPALGGKLVRRVIRVSPRANGGIRW